jgi:hypothetical protein
MNSQLVRQGLGQTQHACHQPPNRSQESQSRVHFEIKSTIRVQFGLGKRLVGFQLAQQLEAIGRTSDEGFNKGDAAAIAAVFIQDAVLLLADGPVYGNQL